MSSVSTEPKGSSTGTLGDRVQKAVAVLREWISPPPQENDPDLQFLSTRRIIGAGRLIILVFFVGFFGWAAIAPLDSAVQAPGIIVVESHRKTIQHLEGGIVRDVPVKEGEVVQAGQLLVQMDDTQARASLELLQGEGYALAAQEARLSAERDGADHIQWPAFLLQNRADNKVAEAVKGEQNTFDTRQLTLRKQSEILSQRDSENNSQIAGMQKELESVDQQIALTNQEVQSVQGLYARGLSTLPRLLQLQRQAADLIGQRGQIVEKIAGVRLSTGENQLQVMNIKNQFMSDVVKDLRDAQTKRFDLLDRLHAAQDVLNRTVVRAPVAGKVVSLVVHTKGAVVRPGDTIMEVVPMRDALDVEAHVRPEDADSIHIGMPAEVTMSAYQRRRLPTITGMVTGVSADRLTDQRTGAPYFSVIVTVDPGPLKAYTDAKIVPGLPVEVALETGQRTALSYFTEPITDVFRKGMREK